MSYAAIHRKAVLESHRFLLQKAIAEIEREVHVVPMTREMKEYQITHKCKVYR